jgi:hypothetical protein
VQLCSAQVYLEQDIKCSNRTDPVQLYIQSKSTGIANIIRTVDNSNDIIICGHFEMNSNPAKHKGLGAKIFENGTLAWAYLFPIACEVLVLDTRQENGMFGLYFPNRGLELHAYNLELGEKNYLYEYQDDTITKLSDITYYNDYYWIVFYGNSTSPYSYILKISKTRRSIYQSTTETSLINVVFPGDNPAFVGYTASNEPFMIQLNETSFQSIWKLKITSFNSSYMSFRNKQHGDANMVWALSDVSESKLYITYLNANESSVVWTNSYITGVQNVSISYASVFEEFMLLYLDTVNSRN